MRYSKINLTSCYESPPGCVRKLSPVELLMTNGALHSCSFLELAPGKCAADLNLTSVISFFFFPVAWLPLRQTISVTRARLYAKGVNYIPLTQTGALWQLLKIAIGKACAQHRASCFCDSLPEIVSSFCKLYEG